MKDTITKILLILLAIIVVVTAFILIVAEANYIGALAGHWASVTFIVVVALAVLCVALLSIPDRGNNNKE